MILVSALWCWGQAVCSSAGKESACNAGDPGSIPGSGRFPGEMIGYTLQYSWASLVALLVKNPPATKHKLESSLLGEISITSNMKMTPLLWQKAKRNWRASWRKWKRRVKKLAYNSTFRKRRSWHLGPFTSWQIDGNSDRLYFLGLQNHCRWWLQPWN